MQQNLEKEMENTLMQWLYDPAVGKIVGAVIALMIVIFISRLVKASVTRYVKAVDRRYRLTNSSS